MEIWQERGLAIANSNTIEKNKLGWKVPSQSGNGTYIVNLDHDEPFCTCPFFEAHHELGAGTLTDTELLSILIAQSFASAFPTNSGKRLRNECLGRSWGWITGGLNATACGKSKQAFCHLPAFIRNKCKP